MSATEWDDIISAMKARSGRAVDQEMSDATAAQIQQLTGIEVPAERRRFTRYLPSFDFESGLSASEILAVEKRFGFRFPPDLRAFLQTALPQGQTFPNWRSGDEATLRDWLDVPRQGVLFDVEHNGFWLPEWGSRPEPLEQALLIADELVFHLTGRAPWPERVRTIRFWDLPASTDFKTCAGRTVPARSTTAKGSYRSKAAPNQQLHLTGAA